MYDAPAVGSSRSQVGLLLRVKLRGLTHRIHQVVDQAPLRLSLTVVLVGVIWYGLYWMFDRVFLQLKYSRLEATVAIPLMFNVFFLAMLVMLTFSNAIISYGALFAKGESAYLLSSPLSPLDVVTLKYLESLVLASWALVLLGVPLMIAMAEITDNPLFYLLFLAFFLFFIPIPAALGLLLAWASARFVPRHTARTSTVVCGLVVMVAIVFSIRTMQMGNQEIDVWLRTFQARMSFIQAAFLPNHWVAAGIDNAMNDRFSQSVLYLGVTAAHALFLSWIVVRGVARSLMPALDRAASGAGAGRRPASRASGGLAGWIFCYLPHPLRLVAAKDLRTFVRDPLQWSQLVILFGLLVLYLTNMPTLRAELSSWGWYLVIPFLNLCAVSLILATFTCRFVFPLPSLEGQKLWLVGLLPMPRGHILYAKFAFAMTITLWVAVSAMTLASIILELTLVWALVHLLVTISLCFGLCGLSVGVGARLPMFGETNAARIANGLGGTANLIASLVLAATVLAGVGAATWRMRDVTETTAPDAVSLLLCATSVVIAVGVGLLALRAGIRCFHRVEV